MKLFVDDTRVAPKGWKLAKTVTDAIRILVTQQVDVLSLDHDIIYYDADGNSHLSRESFEPVIHFVKLMPAKLRPHTIIVHTANPPAGDKMMNELKGSVQQLIRDWEFGHHKEA